MLTVHTLRLVFGKKGRLSVVLDCFNEQGKHRQIRSAVTGQFRVGEPPCSSPADQFAASERLADGIVKRRRVLRANKVKRAN